MPAGRCAVLVLLVTACSKPSVRPPGEGQLEVRWDGSFDGSLSAPATAEWCGLHRVLQIRGVRGDTGVALAIYPGESLKAGVYPVVDPARAESLPPAAAVAARWLTKNLVQGFRGDSGQVRLDAAGPGRYSGSVKARIRSVVDTARVGLTGTFRDLLIRPDTMSCEPGDIPSVQASEAGDTAVD